MGTLNDAQTIIKSMLKDEIDLMSLTSAVHHLGVIEGMQIQRSLDEMTKPQKRFNFF